MIVRAATTTALIIDVELPNRVCLPISYKLILEFLISMDNIFIALSLYFIIGILLRNKGWPTPLASILVSGRCSAGLKTDGARTSEPIINGAVPAVNGAAVVVALTLLMVLVVTRCWRYMALEPSVPKGSSIPIIALSLRKQWRLWRECSTAEAEWNCFKFSESRDTEKSAFGK